MKSIAQVDMFRDEDSEMVTLRTARVPKIIAPGLEYALTSNTEKIPELTQVPCSLRFNKRDLFCRSLQGFNEAQIKEPIIDI